MGITTKTLGCFFFPFKLLGISFETDFVVKP